MPNKFNQSEHEDSARQTREVAVDERGGWTSASNAAADEACNGRHALSKGIPDETTKDSDRGDRIHLWLTGNEVALNDEEMDIAESIESISKGRLEAWQQSHPKIKEVLIEHRLWHEVDGLKHSGKADVIYISEDGAALVHDYKTGRMEVEEPPTNKQLRDLAVLVAVNKGVHDITVDIIHPFSRFNHPPCRYERNDIAVALVDMEERIKACNAPNAPRNPGPEQCNFCRAKGVCPEFAFSQLPANWTTTELPLSPSQITAGIRQLSDQRLGRFLSLTRMAAEVAEREVRERLGLLPNCVPGWTMRPGRTTETITNPQGVFTKAFAKGVTTERFMEAVKVSKTGLKSALKEATGLKGKALDSALDEVLEGNVEEKQSNPVLQEA